MRWCLVSVATMAILMTAATAKAATSYDNFTVTGKTARDIYKSVVKRSQRKDGFRTYATTNVKLVPHLRGQQGETCSLAKADIEVRAVVHLPEHEDEDTLPASLRKDWLNFTAILKAHEEHHVEIWKGCAKEVEAALLATPPGNCKAFIKAAVKRALDARKKCNARDKEFDDAEHKRLPTIPFIRRALLDN